MAVTPVLVPDQYALTHGSRMLHRFSGDGQFETLGVKAENRLIVQGVVHDGDQIVLRWNAKTITLTARTTPVLATDFPAGNGSSAYVDTLFAYFKSYFPFRSDFVLERANVLFPLIKFTARRVGPAYNMVFVKTPILGEPATVMGSFALALETGGAAALIRERYGVYCEIYLQKRGTAATAEADFELITTKHVECDSEGLADLDVGEIIHGYLSADIPDFSAQGGQLALDSHRAYYIAYGEAWGNPIEPKTIIDDDIRHAYLGGADFLNRSGSGFNLMTQFKGTNAAADRALRFGPTASAIRIDQPEFLTFANLRDEDQQVTLAIELTFDDDDTEAWEGIQAVVDYPAGAKVCFPVGIQILNLLDQVPTGKFLKEYSVRLQNTDGDFLSRAYRFIVDYDQPEFRKYILFLSSLGAFQGIMTYGKGSRELQRFYDQATQYLPAFYNPTDALYVDFNTSLQHTFEVASGWQTKETLARWDDLYRSPIRLLVVGTRVYAIGLTSKTIQLDKDGDTQFAHKLELAFLHLDEYYTDVVTPDGDETLPPIVAPVGTVIVSPQVVTPVTDPSIPAFVRELTLTDVNGFKQAKAWGNHALAGYLNQASGNVLYRQKSVPVDYLTDLANKPTPAQLLEQLSSVAPNLRFRLGVPVGLL